MHITEFRNFLALIWLSLFPDCYIWSCCQMAEHAAILLVVSVIYLLLIWFSLLSLLNIYDCPYMVQLVASGIYLLLVWFSLLSLLSALYILLSLYGSACSLRYISAPHLV